MYQANDYDISAVMPEAIASGLFVSLVTIQEPTGEQTSTGAPARTGGDTGDGWNNVVGLIDIAAMNAPQSESRLTADQHKTTEMVEGFQLRHMLLAGWYPTIAENSNWRAIVDGTAWDILGVESDSQGTQTRLRLQVATV